jgi:hypothetical protein
MIEGSGSGSVYLSLTNGSVFGSGRPKTYVSYGSGFGSASATLIGTNLNSSRGLYDNFFINVYVWFGRILKRESFKEVTRCEAEGGERRLHHPQDKGAAADTARLGLGFVLLMGALYVGKKILRK